VKVEETKDDIETGNKPEEIKTKKKNKRKKNKKNKDKKDSSLLKHEKGKFYKEMKYSESE